MRTLFDAADILGAVADELRPIATIPTAEYAEAHIILPAKSSAEPGPLRLTALQRGILEAFDDPAIHTVAMMLNAQAGKSTILNSILASTIGQAPAPTLFVLPTDSHATAYVRERLDPLINSSPEIASRIGNDKSGNSGNSLAFKDFRGDGFLAIASSYKTEDLAARAIKLLIADEVDRFYTGGAEGNPLTIALKRQTTFRERKAVIASTPTRPGASQIAEWYERGDKRQFEVPCPDCGVFAPLTFERVHWTVGKPETAYLTCECCGVIIGEAARQKIIERGKWEPTCKGEPGVASFQANALTSRFASLAGIAAEFEAAKDEGRRRVFWQTVLAEPYSGDQSIELDHERLRAQAVPLALDKLPKAIEHITAAVDVQADRVELQWCGHGGGSIYLLHHEVIPFETSAIGEWSALYAALERTFKTEDGRGLSASLIGIDSGYVASTVYQAVYQLGRMGKRAIALKGKGGFGLPTIKGPRRPAPNTPYIIGVDDLRQSILRRLSIMPDSSAGARANTEGRIILNAALPELVFMQICAERLTWVDRNGYAKPKWEKDKSIGNEGLDCLLYNAALANFLPQLASAPPPSTKTQTPTAKPMSAAEIGARLNQHSTQRNQSSESRHL